MFLAIRMPSKLRVQESCFPIAEGNNTAMDAEVTFSKLTSPSLRIKGSVVRRHVGMNKILPLNTSLRWHSRKDNLSVSWEVYKGVKNESITLIWNAKSAHSFWWEIADLQVGRADTVYMILERHTAFDDLSKFCVQSFYPSTLTEVYFRVMNIGFVLEIVLSVIITKHSQPWDRENVLDVLIVLCAILMCIPWETFVPNNPTSIINGHLLGAFFFSLFRVLLLAGFEEEIMNKHVFSTITAALLDFVIVVYVASFFASRRKWQRAQSIRSWFLRRTIMGNGCWGVDLLFFTFLLLLLIIPNRFNTAQDLSFRNRFIFTSALALFMSAILKSASPYELLPQSVVACFAIWLVSGLRSNGLCHYVQVGEIGDDVVGYPEPDEPCAKEGSNLE